MARVLSCILAALALTACASTAPSFRFAAPATRNAELGWLALHTVDTLQTVTIARSPDCLYEKSPLARMVYGTDHPSVSRVLMTNTGMAVLHWGMGSMLDRHAEAGGDNVGVWYSARIAFYTMSFIGTGSAVIGNVRLGIKPATTMRCAP
jgi:hypothetical protein